MTDENLKCLTKDPSFVGQNGQRVAKSFREACDIVNSDKIRKCGAMHFHLLNLTS